MDYKLCRGGLTIIFEQIGGLNDEVMRASRLSESQQDAEKGGKTAGIKNNVERTIKQNL